MPRNPFAGVVAEPPVRRGDRENGTQYVLVNSSCPNHQVPVLTIGLKPGSLPRELLEFPAAHVLTDGLKLRTFLHLEDALGVFVYGFALEFRASVLLGCDWLFKRRRRWRLSR